LAERQYPISVDGWFSCGWNTLKERAGDLYRGVALLAVYQGILFLLNLLPGGIFITLIIQLTAGLVISVGWLNYCLRIVRSERVDPASILNALNRFRDTWAVSALLSLMVSVGLVFLVIPGIYLMARYGFSLFAVMDRDLSVSDSFRFSDTIVKGSIIQLAIFFLIAMGSFYITALLFLSMSGRAGLIIMIIYHLAVTPFISLAFASAYDSVVCSYEYIEEERPL